MRKAWLAGTVAVVCAVAFAFGTTAAATPASAPAHKPPSTDPSTTTTTTTIAPPPTPGYKSTTVASATFGPIDSHISTPAVDGADQDPRVVGPLRAAERLGPGRLQLRPEHRLAHPRRAEPGDRHGGHRSPSTTVTIRRARRTSTRPRRRTTRSSTPVTGTCTSSATRAERPPRPSRCSSFPTERPARWSSTTPGTARSDAESGSCGEVRFAGLTRRAREQGALVWQSDTVADHRCVAAGQRVRRMRRWATRGRGRVRRRGPAPRRPALGHRPDLAVDAGERC